MKNLWFLFPFKGSTISQLLLFRCLVGYLITVGDRNVVRETEITVDTFILPLQNLWASYESPVQFRPALFLHTWFSAGEFRNSLHDHIWGLSFCVVLCHVLMQQPRLHQTCSLVVSVATIAWGCLCDHHRFDLCAFEFRTWEVLYSDALSLASNTNMRVKK